MCILKSTKGVQPMYKDLQVYQNIYKAPEILKIKWMTLDQKTQSLKPRIFRVNKVRLSPQKPFYCSTSR